MPSQISKVTNESILLFIVPSTLLVLHLMFLWIVDKVGQQVLFPICSTWYHSHPKKFIQIRQHSKASKIDLLPLQEVDAATQLVLISSGGLLPINNNKVPECCVLLQRSAAGSRAAVLTNNKQDLQPYWKAPDSRIYYGFVSLQFLFCKISDRTSLENAAL